jgi:AraC family transcriptional regulator of adaptative response/methylated-DNA-[protein]-cysteine methyltransferase
MQRTGIETSDGVFTASFTERGLARLEFPSNGQTSGREIQRSTSVLPKLPVWQQLTATALRQILSGKSPTKLPPLDLSAGTGFQRRIWSALQRIPLGETKSYSEVAAAAGRPQAVRAAGSACGANPIAVLVPCHRVLSEGGGLGGFSSDLRWKRILLSREGVAVT